MRKKLIEVPHPLEAINTGAARKPSIRLMNPSTPRLRSTRRQPAASRPAESSSVEAIAHGV